MKALSPLHTMSTSVTICNSGRQPVVVICGKGFSFVVRPGEIFEHWRPPPQNHPLPPGRRGLTRGVPGYAIEARRLDGELEKHMARDPRRAPPLANEDTK